MEPTTQSHNNEASAKDSPCDDLIPLMRLELDKHNVLTAGKTDAEVQGIYDGWREKRAAEKEDRERRAVEERRERAEAALLEGLRKTLDNAGIDHQGMTREQMQAHADGIRREWESKQREAAAEQTRKERQRVSDHRFLSSGCPARHVVNMYNRLDENKPWLDTLNLLSGKLPAGFIVALLGKRGTGKTQLAVALIRKACNVGHTARYVKALDLFREIRGAYTPVARGQAGEREEDVIDRLASVGLLVIDECHQRGETPFEQNTLINLLDRRYDGMRATVLISNQTRAEFSASMGDSVVSRIHESGEAIECNWESHRKPGQWKEA